eukprot:101628-Prymnesium_polylepis.1
MATLATLPGTLGTKHVLSHPNNDKNNHDCAMIVVECQSVHERVQRSFYCASSPPMVGFTELKRMLREAGVPPRELWTAGSVPALIMLGERHNVPNLPDAAGSLPSGAKHTVPSEKNATSSMAATVTQRRLERMSSRSSRRNPNQASAVSTLAPGPALIASTAAAPASA